MTASLTGRTLGRYVVGDAIGSGPTGTVYKAWDPEYQTERALKAFDRLDPADHETVLRLYHEIAAAAQLRHPNVVPVYDVFEVDGVLCVLAELVPARSLADRLRSERLPLSETARIAADVAAALDGALGHGILHRDLKPSNILLREPDGAVLLTDFGLGVDAASVPDAGSDAPAEDPSAYRAPEVEAPEQAVDWRVDIYSLAAVAYEMVTGRAPVPWGDPFGPGPYRPPAPARSLNPALPPRVDEVLARGLAADPSQRPDWPGALARDLASAFAGDGASGTRPTGILPWLEDEPAAVPGASPEALGAMPSEAAPTAVVPLTRPTGRNGAAAAAAVMRNGAGLIVPPVIPPVGGVPANGAAAVVVPPVVPPLGTPDGVEPPAAAPLAVEPPPPPFPELVPDAEETELAPRRGRDSLPAVLPPIEPLPPQAPPRRRRGRKLAALMLLVLLAATTFGVAGAATGRLGPADRLAAGPIASASRLVAAAQLRPAAPADLRPAGVTDAMVVQAVGDRLQACAAETAPDPTTAVTCPQQGDRHGELAEHWTLAGNPTAGAVVKYVGSGQFRVMGHFVMVLEGQDPTYFPQVDAAPYEADVRATDGQVDVVRVVRALAAPPVPRASAATDAMAVDAAHALFTACQRSAAQQPATAEACPTGPFQPCGRVTMQRKFALDQTASPVVKYDDQHGIVHVTGWYALDQTATSTTPGCPASQTGHASGDYDVWMVWQGAGFEVVDSIYQPS